MSTFHVRKTVHHRGVTAKMQRHIQHSTFNRSVYNNVPQRDVINSRSHLWWWRTLMSLRCKPLYCTGTSTVAVYRVRTGRRLRYNNNLNDKTYRYQQSWNVMTESLSSWVLGKYCSIDNISAPRGRQKELSIVSVGNYRSNKILNMSSPSVIIFY